MSPAWAWFLAFLVMSGLFALVFAEYERLLTRELRHVTRLIELGERP